MSLTNILKGKTGAWLLWILTLFGALTMAAAGAGKFAAPQRWQALFAGWGYPPWFMILTGTLEIGGSLLLLIPGTAIYAAGLLAAVMAGALYTGTGQMTAIIVLRRIRR